MTRAVNKLAASVNVGVACVSAIFHPGSPVRWNGMKSSCSGSLFYGRKLDDGISPGVIFCSRVTTLALNRDTADEALTSMKRTLMIILGEIARLGRVGPDYTN
jgi:hypothetical protein